MFAMDAQRGRQGGDIYRTGEGFTYPLQRDRQGRYKIRSGELIRVCMTSDFFIEEADAWRDEAWSMIRLRCDVKFFLLTKRPERVAACLPADWGEGWANVFFNVSCENQRRADERIPWLLALPFKHKGIMAAPLIGAIDLAPYLQTRQIEQVIAGGENYGSQRPCHFEWILALRGVCQSHDVNFCFIETGTHFVKDGKSYRLQSKRLQSEMAWKSGASFSAQPLCFRLTDRLGFELAEADVYRPVYRDGCATCASRPICNGCSHCRGCP
jgi:protein gp37